MKTDQKIRQELIDFIKDNDKHYANANLEYHSLAALVMIKTGIKIRIAEQRSVYISEFLLKSKTF